MTERERELFGQATEAQVDELLFFVDKRYLYPYDIDAMIAWVKGERYPGGAAGLLEILREHRKIPL